MTTMIQTVCLVWLTALIILLVFAHTVHTEAFVEKEHDSSDKRRPKPASTNSQTGAVQKMRGQLKNMPNIKSVQKTLHHAQNLQLQLEPIYYSLIPKATDDDTVVNLLWSGGVASTYRLCKLLLVHKRTVRPIYLAQKGLDRRRSAYQERLTVRELHKYIVEHHPSTKDRLLPIEVYESPVTRNATNRQTIEALAHLFQTRPYSIAPFYTALANLHHQMNKSHTELSTRPFEIVLPSNGPHQMLRSAVERWGTRPVFDKPDKPLAEWFGDADEDQAGVQDERAIAKCMYVVLPPATVDAPEQQRQAVFAQLFRHLRFVLPCEPPPVVHSTAKKYRFLQVLQRTWTCREPVFTPRQQHQNKANANTILKMPTVPVGACKKCVSCRQREWDGIERVI
jgi:hypothetical protein